MRHGGVADLPCPPHAAMPAGPVRSAVPPPDAGADAAAASRSAMACIAPAAFPPRRLGTLRA
jgi:hypothetical protein